MRVNHRGTGGGVYDSMYGGAILAALGAIVALGGGCDAKTGSGNPAAGSATPSPVPAPTADAARSPSSPASGRANADATAPAAGSDPSILGPGGIGLAEPLPRKPGTLRIATYNLENLFDDKDDPKYSGRHDDVDDAKPLDQLKALAGAIHRIDADVLAVEEIESLATLTAFRDTYLADMGYTHIVSIDSGDDRGIEQGVLSRYPLENPKVWPDLPLGGTHPATFGDQPNDFAGQPITYRRSPLRVDVTVPAAGVTPGTPAAPGTPAPYRLTLFVVHHKSGRGGGYWREAEARKAVELIAQAEAATPGEDNVIVLGDFNASRSDDSVKIYFDHGFITADRLAKANPDVKARKWKEAAWTTHASNRSIDMILLNPGVAKEFVPQSMFVLGMPQRPRGSDWRTTPAPTGYASDHQPVVIDLVPRD